MPNQSSFIHFGWSQVACYFKCYGCKYNNVSYSYLLKELLLGEFFFIYFF
jgi:hypothetical protein